MRLIWTTLIFIIAFDGCSSSKMNNTIIEIWNVPYILRVPVGYTIGDVINYNDVSYYRFINDEDFVDTLYKVMKEFDGNPQSGMDARIVIIVSNDNRIDTLALGGYYMYYKDIESHVDVDLLKMIAHRLNTYDEKAIVTWIEEWNP